MPTASDVCEECNEWSNGSRLCYGCAYPDIEPVYDDDEEEK